MSDEARWIVIEDELTTAVLLETAVEQRLARRRATMGTPSPIDFPAFGYLSPMPQPPENGTISKTLYHHLRRLNEMPLPETSPLLHPSPATKVPILGRMWAMVREQAHQLILFYVNRYASHETVVNNHTLNMLNELTRLTQSQHEEILQLQEELTTLQGNRAHE